MLFRVLLKGVYLRKNRGGEWVRNRRECIREEGAGSEIVKGVNFFFLGNCFGRWRDYFEYLFYEEY